MSFTAGYITCPLTFRVVVDRVSCSDIYNSGGSVAQPQPVAIHRELGTVCGIEGRQALKIWHRMKGVTLANYPVIVVAEAGGEGSRLLKNTSQNIKIWITCFSNSYFCYSKHLLLIIWI